MAEQWIIGSRVLDTYETEEGRTKPVFDPIELLIDRAVDVTSISRHDLLNIMRRHSGEQGRSRKIAHARFGLMWVMKHRLGWSYPKIAKRLGYEDHTSIIYGVRRAEEWRKFDLTFFAYTNDLMRVRIAPKQEVA
jgi:hypothetical protein